MLNAILSDYFIHSTKKRTNAESTTKLRGCRFEPAEFGAVDPVGVGVDEGVPVVLVEGVDLDSLNFDHIKLTESTPYFTKYVPCTVELLPESQ
jgi:hypothetical protein